MLDPAFVNMGGCHDFLSCRVMAGEEQHRQTAVTELA